MFNLTEHEREQLAEVLRDAEYHYDERPLLSTVAKFMKRLGDSVHPRLSGTEVRTLRRKVAQIEPARLPELMESLRSG